MKVQVETGITRGNFDDNSAFSLLLKANTDPGTKYPLDTQEIVGALLKF